MEKVTKKIKDGMIAPRIRPGQRHPLIENGFWLLSEKVRLAIEDRMIAEGLKKFM